jgi:hypothetical protein
LETLDLLDENNIAHSGVGRNLREAMKPAAIDLKIRQRPYQADTRDSVLRGSGNSIGTSKTGSINKKADSIIRTNSSGSSCNNRLMTKSSNMKMIILMMTIFGLE